MAASHGINFGRCALHVVVETFVGPFSAINLHLLLALNKKKTLDLIKKIDLQWNQHHVISYKTYQFQISQHLEYGLL